VLLAGDASFDPKNYLGFGDLDFIPTKLIDTEFSEAASDDWFADFNNDGLAEMAVGRLPIHSVEEATSLVAKLVNNKAAASPAAALLVSDANDGFDFEGASAHLRLLVESQTRVTEIRRGQVDAATAKAALLEAIYRGQNVVNYVGHGSVNSWRGNLLTSEEARNLTNGSQPLFVMMTCLNGYFHDPARESLGESLINAARGGAIAVWASSGMTTPQEQAVMNQEFFKRLFSAGSKGLTIGEAAQQAKATIVNTDIRRSWILLGDPTLRLK
jgi:hypothetical protein